MTPITKQNQQILDCELPIEKSNKEMNKINQHKNSLLTDCVFQCA